MRLSWGDREVSGPRDTSGVKTPGRGESCGEAACTADAGDRAWFRKTPTRGPRERPPHPSPPARNEEPLGTASWPSTHSELLVQQFTSRSSRGVSSPPLPQAGGQCRRTHRFWSCRPLWDPGQDLCPLHLLSLRRCQYSCREPRRLTDNRCRMSCPGRARGPGVFVTIISWSHCSPKTPAVFSTFSHFTTLSAGSTHLTEGEH